MKIKMKKRTGRKEKIYKKYSLLWISVIALVVLDISVASVSAYFSDREEKRNRITVGDSNIEIVEEFDPPEKIEPGSHFIKKVCMKNLGKSDCFIRCRLELSSEEILPYLEFDIDKAKWSLEEDGYYYYREAVEVKKQTTNLLEEIQIKENAPSEVTEKGFSVLVYAESYQQGNFEKNQWKEAWEHFERNQHAKVLKMDNQTVTASASGKTIQNTEQKAVSKLSKADGEVDIELKEYTLDEKGKETAWKNLSDTLPGQKIVKIPRVTNVASECEIRVKIEMVMGEEVEIPITVDLLEGMSKDWSYDKTDGYYYYRKKLKKGESVDIFQGFRIPPVWDTRYTENKAIKKYYTENTVDVVVTVEAIGEEQQEQEEKWQGEKTVVSSVNAQKTSDETKKMPFFFAIASAAGVILIYFSLKKDKNNETKI